MKTRTTNHKHKVVRNIAYIFSFILLIAIFWIMDIKDVNYIPASWTTWYSDQIFPLRILIIMIYFGMWWVVIHFWYELWKWIAGLFMMRFYR